MKLSTKGRYALVSLVGLAGPKLHIWAFRGTKGVQNPLRGLMPEGAGSYAKEFL